MVTMMLETGVHLGNVGLHRILQKIICYQIDRSRNLPFFRADSQHVETAVSRFERLVEEVAEGQRGPGERLECAKREARVLARASGR